MADLRRTLRLPMSCILVVFLVGPQGAAALEQSVTTGAIRPQNETIAGRSVDGSHHWSFQPVRDPPVPRTRDHEWGRTSVDPFVLARLEDRNLSPSPAADRRTLIRRLTFDLLGLPPTYEEFQDFQNDPAPDAYDRLVDRLLASPRYGERWGRLWLDVARYADTKGFAYLEDLNYYYAYSYRDYVIRAFNDDLPYDEFIIQQLAADRLAPEAYGKSAAALGFLTLGPRFMSQLDDVIDDRIDVVTRGLMGLTVACARCHDHKYDPIPTADYYSLYGVFRSSSEPLVGPLVGDPPDTGEYRSYQKELDRRVEALTDFVTQKHAELIKGARDRVDEYLLAAQRNEDSGVVVDNFMIIVEEGELNPTMILGWQSLLRRTRRLRDAVMEPWHALAALPEERFSEAAQKLVVRFMEDACTDSPQRINPLLARAIASARLDSMEDVAAAYGEVLGETDRLWQKLVQEAADTAAPGPVALADSAREELRQLFYAPGAPANIPLPDIGFNVIRLLPDRPAQEILTKLLKDVEVWSAKGKATPRAMVLRDSGPPHEPRVFYRGNPAQPRESVPRQFLGAVTGADRRPFSRGSSGRLDLARAITDPANPLTARVFVNRSWLQHFGESIARTLGDFGLRSERPLHDKLLDHLASRFVEDDWSVKKLNRRILLSATYRQASAHRPDCHEIDAENHLFWKQNIRRREFEGIRDSLLAAAGTLDERMGGVPSDLLARPFPKRRAVYGTVDRGDLPNLFSTFDFPSPDTPSVRRSETTVPQQALFMMNNHFVIECAGDLLERVRVEAAAAGGDTVRALYRVLFVRDPRAAEIRAVREFLREFHPAREEHMDWDYGRGEIDDSTGRLVRFNTFSHWSGVDWRVSESSEGSGDSASVAVHLNTLGGRTSPASGPAVVRRWTAPEKVRLVIRGTLGHVAQKETVKEGDRDVERKKGDGVQARIVSSRRGVLGCWNAHGDEASTESKIVEMTAGETLDFVVDGKKDGSDDSFEWEVSLYSVDDEERPADTPRWNSRVDFRGVQAGPWQQLVQALLISNEFIFVD